ncbi:hypothetical protein OVA24_08430 [Luteolibacter sp. SL250]|uniref:LamG-like jellyroll fold domain-containing protein n=1 Tax=Luteolibacter sp. SL250 TaxID=2995170 RepID=UPI00226E4C69|nr:LamG-like jellyroll fold domain-containing protein [Luteolibacter sp. SL250]WAC21411.1 hypothetical protein OVA24_08430 [Luteolibacter sp. SL250]
MSFSKGLVLAALVGAVCFPVADGALLLRYDFDDGTTPTADSGTGPAANGTLIGAGSSFIANTPSGTGRAYSTSGANAYITTGTTASPDTGTNPSKLDSLNAFTLTMWLNIQAQPATNDRLVSDWSGDAGFDLRVGSNVTSTDYRPLLQVNNSLASPTSNIGGFGSWVFLAVTYDGSQLSSNVLFYTGGTSSAATQFGSAVALFQNNTDPTPDEPEGAVLANSVDFQVGGSAATTSDRSPNAFFDDVRVYDEVLSVAQLEAIRLENVPEPSLGSLALLTLAGLATRRRR